MNDLSLALIRKGKGTGVVAGTTSHDLELALARRYGDGGGDEPAPTLTAYLTFESAYQFTLTSSNGNKWKTWDGTLAYSFNGANWFIWDGTKTLYSKRTGSRYFLYLGGYGNTDITGSGGDGFKIEAEMTGSVSCSGDIRSLLDYEKAAANQDPPMAEACFSRLFYSNPVLASAPDLPSMTLSSHCYNQMFESCTGLTVPPALPATTLADYCYLSMFENSGLVMPPELPATTLTAGCYDSMFFGCNDLTSAPELPATTMAYSCYHSMFRGCQALVTPPDLPAMALAQSCYDWMFAECSSLQRAPALPATTLKNSCYAHMFYGCRTLHMLPELPATDFNNTTAGGCYRSMFVDCAALKFSETQTAECPNAYRIPSSGTGTDYGWSKPTEGMITGTGGTFTGTMAVNTTYYTNATIVPAA